MVGTSVDWVLSVWGVVVAVVSVVSAVVVLSWTVVVVSVVVTGVVVGMTVVGEVDGVSDVVRDGLMSVVVGSSSVAFEALQIALRRVRPDSSEFHSNSAPVAGVDLSKYPNPMTGSPEAQLLNPSITESTYSYIYRCRLNMIYI